MPGRIIEELLTSLQNSVPNVDEIKVNRVCIGLGYTGVQLSTRHVGLCYTLQSEIARHCCQISERAGTLAGSAVLEIANLAKSWDVSESVVGVATLNALSQVVIEKDRDKYSIFEGNLIDSIKMGKGDTVALVGNIRPLVPIIRSKAKHLYILERNPMLREEGVLPDFACEEILPQADVIIITGSALANGTIDHVLDLSKEAKEVGLVGASASVLPDPLFDHGVTIIGAVKILNAEKVLQIIMEAGGTHKLKAAVSFIAIRRRRP